MTFDEAREVLLRELGRRFAPDAGTPHVADYGWEDAASFAPVYGAREWLVDDDPAYELLDLPVLLVDKVTGAISSAGSLPAAIPQLDRMVEVGAWPDEPEPEL